MVSSKNYCVHCKTNVWNTWSIYRHFSKLLSLAISHLWKWNTFHPQCHLNCLLCALLMTWLSKLALCLSPLLLNKKPTWFMKYVITVSTKVQRRRASCPTPGNFNLSHNDHASVVKQGFFSMPFIGSMNCLIDWARLSCHRRAVSVTLSEQNKAKFDFNMKTNLKEECQLYPWWSVVNLMRFVDRLLISLLPTRGERTHKVFFHRAHFYNLWM